MGQNEEETRANNMDLVVKRTAEREGKVGWKLLDEPLSRRAVLWREREWRGWRGRDTPFSSLPLSPSSHPIYPWSRPFSSSSSSLREPPFPHSIPNSPPQWLRIKEGICRRNWQCARTRLDSALSAAVPVGMRRQWSRVRKKEKAREEKGLDTNSFLRRTRRVRMTDEREGWEKKRGEGKDWEMELYCSSSNVSISWRAEMICHAEGLSFKVGECLNIIGTCYQLLMIVCRCVWSLKCISDFFDFAFTSDSFTTQRPLGHLIIS